MSYIFSDTMDDDTDDKDDTKRYVYSHCNIINIIVKNRDEIVHVLYMMLQGLSEE
jgi:hypothetical protein